ncbi:RagB/SusD family nutrient uptake outer membrane protein [Rufibacter hautae]|uniref:RagB/SusD family nutrient uptake outer membrane protein n=1 Tax=Rufibacter hautae TaxID=2595005 RepID=A0A5B6THY4_9BACT|nr:RagB/SusD family nutrient uptake outer membrane protein [Rufibacter hautae]KAA3438800.1 RagB/SusD family nutrient uptake outer membrane protein [Rufibacter hautae]
MKKIKSIILVGLLTSLNFACNDDFLDQVPDDRLTLEATFKNRNTVEQYLANVYSQIPDDASQRGLGGDGNVGPWLAASDEAEYVWGFVGSNSVNIGAWDPSAGFVNSIWSNFYRGIRRANVFIENVDQCTDCGADGALVKRYKAEARALRGLYYFHLMRLYGPIVLVGNESIPVDAPADELKKPRNTYDECVAYVLAELNAAAADLPTVATEQNYGRMTKSYVQAIKSQVLLYSASPLFNGNADYASLVNKDGQQLINQQYDVNKWKLAADAAKAFIDEYVPGTFDLYRKNNAQGQFDPYLSTRDVFLDEWNKEVIFARVDAGINPRQYEMTPFHAGSQAEAKGSGGLGATQHIVDAYFTANGRSIEDPKSGYMTSGFSSFKAPNDTEARQVFNQWVNREPRFYVGITYDNSLWLNRNTGNIVTRTWFSGNSGKNSGAGNDYTPTGYIVRKNMSTGDWRNGDRSYVMLRLAEIYLNYAEALNEYSPGHPDILTYVNLIRNRAGIPEYGSAELEAPTGQAAVREAIWKERRVELAFENVRYFDARRWKIAETAFNGPTFALDISAPDINNFYNKVPFETRVFTKRHYLWPIPQSEMNINQLLVQNTGW